MKTKVTFRQGDPSSSMTRDEVVTWLIGSVGGASFTSALAIYCAITGVVDGLREGPGVMVDTPQGHYVLTVTVSGRWYRRVRTYHAEEA